MSPMPTRHGFRARDLARSTSIGCAAVGARRRARADGTAINPAPAGAGGAFESNADSGHEIRPAGNAVSLEDEMMKVASNQMDYQAATRSTAAASADQDRAWRQYDEG